MAFITNSVCKRFLGDNKVEVEEINLNKFFMDYILNDRNVYKVFNRSEVKRMLGIASIFNEELYKKIEIRKKTIGEYGDAYEKIFFRGGKPKYHLYKDCEGLHNRYFDLYVPEEFNSLIHPKNIEKFLVENKLTLKGYENRLRNVELFPENENNRKELKKYEDIIKQYERTKEDKLYSKHAIEYLRNWFDINQFVRERFENGEVKIENVINKYNVEIVKKYIGLKKIQNIKDIMKANTGDVEISSLSKEQIYERIDLLIKERENLLKRNPDILHRISRFDWLLKSNKTPNEKREMLINKGLPYEPIDKIEHFWEEHLHIKKELEKVLIAYINVHNGTEEGTLNFHGFECCKLCQTRKINEQLNRKI